jgi:hypothetical protein
MEGENRVNRLKIQRLESRRKTRDIYKVVGCLMPYRLCAASSAQLTLSSVSFMQQELETFNRVTLPETTVRQSCEQRQDEQR